MSANSSAGWYHSNQYAASESCEHCGGVVRHEHWCITCDPVVRYAYEAVLDPEKLTLSDALALRGLGVQWKHNGCSGTCQGS